MTLNKFEFDAIMEVITPAMATGTEVSALKREIDRIRKLARPPWKACERVSKQMARRGCKAEERKIREWKFILDDARVVYWSDLPQRLRHRWKKRSGQSIRAERATVNVIKHTQRFGDQTDMFPG